MNSGNALFYEIFRVNTNHSNEKQGFSIPGIKLSITYPTSKSFRFRFKINEEDSSSDKTSLEYFKFIFTVVLSKKII